MHESEFIYPQNCGMKMSIGHPNVKQYSNPLLIIK